jgi:hypothetical protein
MHIVYIVFVNYNELYLHEVMTYDCLTNCIELNLLDALHVTFILMLQTMN